jgi:hypothetical protein
MPEYQLWTTRTAWRAIWLDTLLSWAGVFVGFWGVSHLFGLARDEREFWPLFVPLCSLFVFLYQISRHLFRYLVTIKGELDYLLKRQLEDEQLHPEKYDPLSNGLSKLMAEQAAAKEESWWAEQRSQWTAPVASSKPKDDGK